MVACAGQVTFCGRCGAERHVRQRHAFVPALRPCDSTMVWVDYGNAEIYQCAAGRHRADARR